MPNAAMGRAEWTSLLLLSGLWSGSFFFSKVALAEVPPLTVVLVRVAVAAAALGLYLRVRGQSIPREPSAWTAFFGMGVLNNLVPFSLLFWGQTHIPSGLASILNAATPVFSIVLAHLLTRDERMNPAKIAGVALGIGGVAVLIGPGLMGRADASLPGMLACLGAALSYGFAAVFGRRFGRMGIPPQIGAFGQVTATTAMMLPIALAVDHPWALPWPSPATIAALLALGLASTALAYVIFFRILAAGGATNVSLVTLLVPVGAILLGSLVLGERLGSREVAGMVLVALGLVVIDGRLGRRLVGNRPPAEAGKAVNRE